VSAAAVAGAATSSVSRPAGVQMLAGSPVAAQSGAAVPPADRPAQAAGGCSLLWVLALGGLGLALLLMAGAGVLAWQVLGDDDATATPTQAQALSGSATATEAAGPTATAGPGTATDAAPSATTPPTTTETATSEPPTATTPPTATPTLAPPTATIEGPPATTALLAENLVAGWSSFSGDWGESFAQRNTYVTRVNATSSGRIFYSGDSYTGAIQADATVRFVQFDPSSFACLWVRYATDDTGTNQSGYRLCATATSGIFADWLNTTNGWTDFEQTSATIQAPAGLDPNVPVTLSIVTQGDRLWFVVNGVTAGQFTHSGATEGRIAFETAHDLDVGLLEVEFSDVNVWSVE
jgi:hypothetical protein